MDDDTLLARRSAHEQLSTMYILGFGAVAISLAATAVFSIKPRAKLFIDTEWVILIGIIGFIIPWLERANWRVLGFISISITILWLSGLIALMFDKHNAVMQAISIFGFWLLTGAVSAYMHKGYRRMKESQRFPIVLEFYSWENYSWVVLAVWGVISIILMGEIFNNIGTAEYWLQIQHYIFVALGGLLTAFSWVRLRRHVYELWVESWARILYKIRIKGPGVNEMPMYGPMIIIANHACWWDPLFIAGNICRPVTPMMTSGFYDIWHLRPFMQHVVKAIRVPDKPVRHETPELHEAISALDRGECLVIFPEGYLRRKEEVPLRRFGRGIHEILKNRPNTPVVAAWIEGGWGSWCSYKDGPPTKNKRIDFRRRIDVGFSSPIVVPAEVLENHWPTRVFLMNAVSGARRHLGLEPLSEFRVSTSEAAEESVP